MMVLDRGFFCICVEMFGPHASKDKKGSIVGTLEALHRRGCLCMQMFVGSTYGQLSEASEKRYYDEAPAVKKTLKALGMKLFIHAPYTFNLAKDVGADGLEPLWKQVQIADALGADGVVLHMGKAVKLDVAEAQRWFYENLCNVIGRMKAAKCHTKLFIETSAGQGTELYPTLEANLDPLGEFYDQFTAGQRKYIGLCVDTCHVFAAGYDISASFWKEFNERIGIEHLGVVHMNNSVKGLGSRVDRHAPLEAGKIDFDALAAFAKKANELGVPMIVETPSLDRDVIVIKKWLEGKYSKEAVDREMRDAMFAL